MPNWREAKEEMEEEERHKLIFPTFPFERLRRKASGRGREGPARHARSARNTTTASNYHREERERGEGRVGGRRVDVVVVLKRIMVPSPAPAVLLPPASVAIAAATSVKGTPSICRGAGRGDATWLAWR